ncbi:hypothetical protein ACJ41O_007289 [Fusarium nematophilum]
MQINLAPDRSKSWTHKIPTRLVPEGHMEKFDAALEMIYGKTGIFTNFKWTREDDFIIVTAYLEDPVDLLPVLQDHDGAKKE